MSGIKLTTKLDAQKSVSLGNLRIAKAIYNFGVDGGSHTVASGLLTPKKGVTLPKNAVIVGGTLNCPTAGASGGSATITLGTSAGSSASALLGATAGAVANLSTNALINLVPTIAVPVKLTAKGDITMTIGTADLTAGIFEICVYYYVTAS
jgi:outer membrane lipoprotein SlyB